MSKNIEKLITESLTAKYLGVWRQELDFPHDGNWMTRTHPMVVFLEEGQMETEFAGMNAEILVRRAGDVCLYPANVKRRGRVCSKSGAKFAALGVSFEISHGIDVLDFFEVPRVFDASCSGAIKDIIHGLLELEGERNRNPFQKVAIIEKKCYSVLELILSNSEIRQDLMDTFFSLERYLPVLEYLNSNYRKPHDIPSLCRRFGISRSHFFREFKRMTGGSPMEYVKKLRLQEAETLLRTTSQSIAEIAEIVGWSDQFHFSRTFKASIAVSPKKYRELWCETQ